MSFYIGKNRKYIVKFVAAVMILCAFYRCFDPDINCDQVSVSMSADRRMCTEITLYNLHGPEIFGCYSARKIQIADSNSNADLSVYTEADPRFSAAPGATGMIAQSELTTRYSVVLYQHRSDGQKPNLCMV